MTFVLQIPNEHSNQCLLNHFIGKIGRYGKRMQKRALLGLMSGRLSSLVRTYRQS